MRFYLNFQAVFDLHFHNLNFLSFLTNNLFCVSYTVTILYD
eukprot:UN07170